MINREITRTILNTTETTKETQSLDDQELAFAIGTGDAFYVGFPGKYASRYIKMGTINTNTSTLAVKFWDGSSYTPVKDLIDGTNGFQNNGYVHWQNETSWVKSTQAPITGVGVEKFWTEWTVIGGAAVQASATVTSIGATNPNDGETLTFNINGTLYVFEFDNNASVTPGNTAITIGVDAQATFLNAATVITSTIPSIDITGTLDGPQTTGTFTAGTNFIGSAGNSPTLTLTASPTNYPFTDFAGGVDAGELSAGTTLQAVVNLFSTDADLSVYYPELVSDTRWLPDGQTDFLPQHRAAKDWVVQALIQRQVIELESQIVDINRVAVGAIHMAAGLIFMGSGGGEEIRAMANEAFAKANDWLRSTSLATDDNKDGVVQDTERTDISSHTLIVRR